MSEMSDEELMLEVETLRICDAAFCNSKLASRYEIKVSSSELLDALFEECNVNLEDRIPLLKLLLELQNGGNLLVPAPKSNEVSNQTKIRQKLSKFTEKGANVDKLEKIMKIRGSAD